jgi:YHS domain-containing protein/thiol-disulfide isomerase/thioredoxin
MLALVICSPCYAAEGFSWETDLEAAKQLAARTNRLVLVHFGASWCQPCQQLEREVFSKPGFGTELKPNFVGVKLDYDSFPATARQYAVQSIPTDVILTPQGKVIERVQSPLSGPEYVGSLLRVANLARRTGPPAATLTAGQPIAAAAQLAGGSVAPPGDGRYANYYNQQAANAATPVAPNAVVPSAPVTNGGPVLPPQGGAPGGGLSGPQLALPQIPPGNAPLGLEGYCPVSLCEKQVWAPGDARWGMQHRGRTYLFAGPAEQQKFAANPDRYSPVMSGDDPVLALDNGQSIPGTRMFGVSYGERVYLFTSEQSLQTFMQNPKRYTTEALQARK